jgi:lysophospholipase L1-like esterase
VLHQVGDLEGSSQIAGGDMPQHPGALTHDVTQDPLRLVVLGDSLAHGIGATRPDDTLGARMARVLERAGHIVEVSVVAVPGATSLELPAQVRQTLPLDADIALVVVGANDLARFVLPAQSAAALAAAVQMLRAAGVAVVVAPAPDLSCVPGVPAALRPGLRTACDELQRRQAGAAEAAGAVVAPIARQLSDAFSSDPELFSGDRYHPSSAGYARIAAALAPHVVAAAREADLRRAVA